MLKFLDNRSHQKAAKSPKKYLPQFLYGNSYQCPKQFQTDHTLFHKPSYVNPYLNYEKERIVKIPSQSINRVRPSWKSKTDLQSIEQQKIVSSNPDLQDVSHSRYLTSFYNELDKDQKRFRKSKGQFTSFIENNNNFKALGPLHGDQRDETRINQTRRTVWLKPNKSVYESVRRTHLNSSQLNVSLRSSMSKNSQLITQKQRIRQNRQKTYNEYKRSLEKRKHEKSNSVLFQLPKKGPQHELSFYNKNNDKFHRYSFFQNKIQQSESEQLFKDLEKFQVTTYGRLR